MLSLNLSRWRAAVHAFYLHLKDAVIDSHTTIKNGSNIHWCSRRKHIKSRGVKTFEQDENVHLVLPFGKLQKIFARFPEDKLSTINLDLQIQKVFTPPPPALKWNKMIFLQNKKHLDVFILFKSFHPPALNACLLLEHQWMFEPFLIVVFESLNCAQCENMDLKIIKSLLERVHICRRCCKTEEPAGFFLKNRAQFNCSEQTRDSWTTITKQKTFVDRPRTVLKPILNGVVLIISAIFFVLWTKCKHLM